MLCSNEVGDDVEMYRLTRAIPQADLSDARANVSTINTNQFTGSEPYIPRMSYFGLAYPACFLRRAPFFVTDFR